MSLWQCHRLWQSAIPSHQGMAQQPPEWSRQYNRKACFPLQRKSSAVYKRNNSGAKTLLWSTPDTTLTNLLRQPSTMTYCDRLERNCVRIDSTEPPTPTEQSLKRIPWWLKIKFFARNNLSWSITEVIRNANKDIPDNLVAVRLTLRNSLIYTRVTNYSHPHTRVVPPTTTRVTPAGVPRIAPGNSGEGNSVFAVIVLPTLTLCCLHLWRHIINECLHIGVRFDAFRGFYFIKTCFSNLDINIINIPW